MRPCEAGCACSAGIECDLTMILQPAIYFLIKIYFFHITKTLLKGKKNLMFYCCAVKLAWTCWDSCLFASRGSRMP